MGFRLYEGMQLYTDIRCVGDGFYGGYSCGLSMSNSETSEKLHEGTRSDTEDIYTDEEGLILTLHKKVLNDALRVRTVLENNSEADVCVEMITSFAVKGIHADKIHRMLSFWSAEGKLRTETIEDLMLEPSWGKHGVRIEKFGSTGSLPVRKYFPWLVLENEAAHEFIGFQLYCASSWQFEIICQRDETLAVLGGLADRDFGHWKKTIRSGEHFETPEAIIAIGDSLEAVCEKLVRAQHPDISVVDDHMGIAFNEYCTTWGNPSHDNLVSICDKLAGKGIQYLTIDSGWYAQAENWWERIGEWDVNKKRFPQGMKPLCDYIRSKGMIPGIWFEMESVSSQCEYYNNTEHLLHRDGKVITVGGKRFWDMEDPWVLDYLGDKMIGLLKDSGFGYLKVDYNESIGTGCDDEDGLGEGLRKKVLATQEFFRRIKREIPDIVIENCASGGHRLEPSMMELVSQASFSDAHETVTIPIIAANLHRVILPSQNQIWAVMRAEDSDQRIYYSIINTFFGRMCLSGDIYKLSDHQWQLIEEGMAFYNRVSDIIDKGMTICQLCAPGSYNNPQGEQLVIRRYQDRQLVVFHRFGNSKTMDMSVLGDVEIIDSYGCADADFSAVAYLCR